jgi:ACDE family multidrug resistance protein
VRRVTFPLYVGGFLGPFGGAMLIALIPSVAGGLDTSISLVAAAITAYMVPFAALQLVSGTVAERLGARRVVRTGYVVFGAAALACALAQEIWSFIAARAVMGAANVFLSPILLAALSEVVAPEVLGRSVGTFAAAQAAGITLAPALGGALGELSWRLAFLLVPALLVVPRRSLGAVDREPSEVSLRALLNRWMSCSLQRRCSATSGSRRSASCS